MTELQEQAASAASRHIIERPRLTRLLDETSARVIMLVAPAGYGKTTLARQWMRTRTHAWLQATPASADAAQLAARIATAFSRSTGAEARPLLEFLGRINKPVDQLRPLASIQHDLLANWPRDGWLVIDEYEWVSSSTASEEYIGILLEEVRPNLLITTRTRPSWATARRRIYGDFRIVDRDMLRMDDEEARRVLTDVERPAVMSLVKNAAGWPAVLGLAASGPIDHIGNLVPEMLYEYLADELFSKSSDGVRRALPKLALSPKITLDVAKAICGDTASEVLYEASAAGYFAEPADEPSFHPLLRSFLLTKLTDSEDVLESARTLAKLFIEQCRWDDAFYVINNGPDKGALLELIEASHQELLRTGRLVSLSEWLEAARREGIRVPLIGIIEAEVAAREGDTARAEQIAVSAAQDADVELRFRALCVAGRAAHLDNRASMALSHYREAEALARNSGETQEARWGRLLCATSVTDWTELEKALAAFLSYTPQSPEDAMRAANAKLCTGLLVGGLEDAVEEAANAASLAEECDPLIASSYFIALSRSFSLLGRYREALLRAERAIDLVERTQLRFALPHALLSKALSLLGSGEYTAVEEALTTAERIASAIHDRHNLVDARVVRSRLALSQKDPEAAIAATDDPPWGVVDSMRAEYVATRALAFACAGRLEEADYTLGKLAKIPNHPDAIGPSVTARAVVAAHKHDLLAVEDELREIGQLGLLDPLIIALRGSRELSAAIKKVEDPKVIGLLKDHASNDDGDESVLDSLTAREQQVLQLLARGRTNREIASQLVIAEVTAKVHVRNILRKLGVRSRTEAAVLATRLVREARAKGSPTFAEDA
jgi:LuxR family maltose regulon positive regulatory protein